MSPTPLWIEETHATQQDLQARRGAEGPTVFGQSTGHQRKDVRGQRGSLADRRAGLEAVEEVQDRPCEDVVPVTDDHVARSGDVAELGVRALLEKDLCALGTHHVRHPSPDQ